MTYTAAFKKRNERDLVESARALLGLSQGEFARTLLLKESVSIIKRAQELARQEEARKKLAEDKPEGNLIDTQKVDQHGGNTDTTQPTTASASSSSDETVHSSVPSDTEAVPAD